MHVHVIIHNLPYLPHYITTPMHQCIFMVYAWCGHNRMSPPSFYNGLGTIYIASSRGRTIDLTTRDIGSKLRYNLRKVLGTQNCTTLGFASSHCVLCLNPIKVIFNITYILTHTLAYI